jgi:hypothetical protein
MNAGPDVERRISTWLADEVPARAPDRILPATFDRTRHTHQRRFGAAWRTITMNRPWQLAATAVVSVAIIGLGAAWLGGSGGTGGPSTTPSPAPTAAPSRTPLPTPTPQASLPPYPSSGAVEPGTYALHQPGVPTVTLTVPAGWGGGGAGGPVKNDGTTRTVGLSTWIVGNIYANPCKWGDGLLKPPVGPSVDDLASALARQPLRNGTTPTAVTLRGYSGKYLELTTPVGLDFATCSKVPGAPENSPSYFVTWVGPALVDDYMGFAGPGSRDRVWILDLDGVRFVLVATEFRDATAQDLAELQSIIDSVRIEPTPPSSSASPSAGP